MDRLDELEALARKALHADDEPHDIAVPYSECPICMATDAKDELDRLLTGSCVLAIIEIVRAADAMRAEKRNSTYIPVAAIAAYDKARAALTAASEREEK